MRNVREIMKNAHFSILRNLFALVMLHRKYRLSENYEKLYMNTINEVCLNTILKGHVYINNPHRNNSAILVVKEKYDKLSPCAVRYAYDPYSGSEIGKLYYIYRHLHDNIMYTVNSKNDKSNLTISDRDLVVQYLSDIDDLDMAISLAISKYVTELNVNAEYTCLTDAYTTLGMKSNDLVTKTLYTDINNWHSDLALANTQFTLIRNSTCKVQPALGDDSRDDSTASAVRLANDITHKIIISGIQNVHCEFNTSIERSVPVFATNVTEKDALSTINKDVEALVNEVTKRSVNAILSMMYGSFMGNAHMYLNMMEPNFAQTTAPFVTIAPAFGTMPGFYPHPISPSMAGGDPNMFRDMPFPTSPTPSPNEQSEVSEKDH